MANNRPSAAAAREVTGRAVLLYLLAFFGMVIAVNVVMVRAATMTFGGLETQSSYKAGLAFKHEAAAARAQDALHWVVSGSFERRADGQAALVIRARDSAGNPLGGLTPQVRLAHPTDARQDQRMTLSAAAAGEFRGAAEIAAGQWELVLDLYRGEERAFRSRSRVILR
jgi:nitrogen fixation protein FixH